MNNQNNQLSTPGLKKFRLKTFIGPGIIITLLITAGLIIFYYSFKNSANPQQTPSAETALIPEQKNIYWEFLNEIYDKILDKHWKKMNDEELTELYRLAIEKITNSEQVLLIQDKNSLKDLIQQNLDQFETPEEQKQFTVDLATIVLANLEPFGRAGLFTQQKAEELKNTVQNIDPSTDLYQVLEIDQDSSDQEIQQQFEQKSNELESILQDESKSQEEKQAAQNQLALLDRAFETLGNQADRENYNQSGIESSVDSKTLTPNIFYLHLKKMSPTSFEEFQLACNAVDNRGPELNTFILDLRGNLGGSVDLMQWFLGPFIGANTLAYEFYHQDEYEPFKTQVGWLPSLVRYKKVVVLIDEQAQSSAEVMAATLKKYNVGVLVGTPTKGWGSIEAIFPLDNQIDDQETYSMFLVHSLTLREDGQPIESNGVHPHINITDLAWPNQLLAYFDNQELVSEVEKLINP